MKDQYTIDNDESQQEKWNRGLDLFIESVLKPDPALRSTQTGFCWSCSSKK